MKRSRFLATLLAIILSLQMLLVPHGPWSPTIAFAAGDSVPSRDKWVEVPELRTGVSRHFRAGNFMVAEISQQSIHYRDEDSRWQPVAPNLVPTTGGFASQKSNAHVRFTKDETGDRISVDLEGGRRIRMGLDQSFDDAQERPAFDVSTAGGKLRYKDRGGKVEYEYEVTGQSVKESIVLNRFPGRNQFLMPLELTGLASRPETNGNLTLFDSLTNEVKAVIPAPVAVDAAGALAPDASQEIIETGAGPMLAVSVPREWLQDKARKYPVTIDPSVLSGSDLMTATITSPSAVSSLLVKYDLSSVPVGAFVRSATLTSQPSVATGGTVYPITTEWLPNAVTWTSPAGQGTTWPDGGATDAPLSPLLSKGAVEIGTLVQDWMNQSKGNFGFKITGLPSGAAAPILQVVYSRDQLAPVTTLSPKGDLSHVAAPFTVSVTAVDTSPGTVARVELLVDGSVMESRSAAGGDWIVDPRAHGNGSHRLAAVAYDHAGNAGKSQELTYQAYLPDMPVNLSYTGTSLTWEAPPGSAGLQYKVYRTAQAQAVPAPADQISDGACDYPHLTCNLAGLPPIQSEVAHYYVSAVKDNVEGRAAVLRTDIPFAPGAPKVQTDANNMNQVTWAPSLRPNVSYKLYRGDYPGFPANAATFVANVAGTTYPDVRNLMPNGSFETATGWSLTTFPDSSAIVQSPAKFGSSSLKLWRYGADSTNVSQTVHLSPGTYTVSAWSMATGVSGTSDAAYAMILKEYGLSGTPTQVVPFSTGTHDWEQKKITISVPAACDLNVSLQFNGNHSGTAWFDGVQIEPGTEPTDYVEYKQVTGAVYRVTAVDGTYESTPSPDSYVPKSAAPEPPVNITGQALGNNQVQISWAPSPSPEVTYNVYRRGASETDTTTYGGPLVATGVTGSTWVDRRLNYVPNSSFEASLASWTTQNSPTVVSFGHTGSKSLFMYREIAGSLDAWATATAYPTQTVARPLTVSAHSRAQLVQGTGEYQLVATFFASTGRTIFSSAVDFTPGTHDWERKSITYTPTEPVYSVDVKLLFKSTRTGTAWFDSVQLEEGTEPTTWQGIGTTSDSKYTVLAVGADGLLSTVPAWTTAKVSGGPAIPSDLLIRNLGDTFMEATWTAQPGTKYAVDRAQVNSSGTTGTYQVVAAGLTSGLYRNGSNLLKNSGFETWSGLYATSWTGLGSGPSTTAYTGQAVKVQRTSTTGADVVAYQDVALPTPLPSTGPMTLSGMVQVSSASGPAGRDFSLQIEFRNQAGTVLSSSYMPIPVAATTAFQRFTVTAAPPTNTVTARAIIRLAGSNTGTAYFDDLQFEWGAQATPWTDDVVVAGTTYRYRVIPMDSNDKLTLPSAPMAVTVTGQPIAPSGLVATPTGTGAVRLTWSPSPVPGVTYRVYRFTAGTPTAANIVAAGISGTTFTDPGNFLTNSSFETDSNADLLPDGWTWSGTVGNGQTDQANAKFGSGAFRILRSATTDAAQSLTQTILLNQGTATAVTVGGWSKSQAVTAGGASDYALSVALVDAQGATVGTGSAGLTSGTHDWEYRSVTATPTAPAQKAIVTVTLRGGAAGTAWFDGILLQAGSTASDWVDGPVEPGRTYYYQVAAVAPSGTETPGARVVSTVSQPWAPPAAGTDLPGLGLDDRWAFISLAVPGGDAYLNVNTGNLVITQVDSVVAGGRLARVIRRTYNSQAPTVGNAGDPTIGTGWSLNAIQSVRPVGVDIVLTDGDGTEIQFHKNADSSYSPPPTVWMTLTELINDPKFAWRIDRRDGVQYWFDTQGHLLRLSDAYDNRIEYTYDNSGISVTPTVAGVPLKQAEQLENPVTPATLSLPKNGATQVAWKDEAGREIVLDYDAGGRLVSALEPDGAVISYTYDSSQRLSAIADGAGRTVNFEYDGIGRLIGYGWKGVAGKTQFAYVTDANSSVQTTITDPRPAVNGVPIQTTLTTLNGRLVERKDALGNVSRYQYDGAQRLIRAADPRGLVTEVAYEAGAVSPRVYQVTRHAEIDVTTTYQSYSKFDKPGQITDPLGAVTTMEYNQTREIPDTTRISRAGSSSYEYDLSTGLVEKVTDPEGGVTQYVIDGALHVSAIINALNGRTTLKYDNAGNLTESVDPLGNRTQTKYDGAGRTVAVTAPDGGIERWVYDGSGLLVAHHAPDGAVTTYKYDGAGRVIESTDALGETTRWQYDEAGNQIVTFWPNGSLERRDYDYLNRVVRVYDGENLDSAGRPLSSARFTEYVYDAVGNPLQVRLPNGYTASAEYDLLNRVTKESRPPATTAYSYDKAGHVLSVRDGNGKWTKYQYDGWGRLTAVCDATNYDAAGNLKSVPPQGKPCGTLTEYTYDSLDRRVSVINPLGATAQYRYNPLGQLNWETDFLGNMTVYTYDTAGQLVEKLDRNGNTTAYEYDSVGRPTWTRYEDALSGVHNTYDLAGRVTSVSDASGVIWYRYDPVGRVREEDSRDGTLFYEYDQIGNRIALHQAGGAVRYSYDRANRLASITDLTGAVTHVRYDDGGNVAEIDLPGGVTQTNVFDPATSRLSQLIYKRPDTSQSLRYTYVYDTVGNITSIERNDTWPSGTSSTQTYVYDDVYRVASVTSSGTTTYTYDAAGNRLTEQLGGTRSEYVYDKGGLLKSRKYYANATVTTPEETLYAYDGEGNMLQAVSPTRVERYMYNARNQLTREQVGTEFTNSEYDALGRRVGRKVISLQNDGREIVTKSSRYQYEGLYVVAELDRADALRMAYTRLPGGKIVSWYKPGTGTQAENGGAVLTDHLGSVVKMVSASTYAAVNQYDYDVFGKVTVVQESAPQDVKFTGAVLDGTGLTHLGARFYNPSVGRFLTQDTYKGSPWQPWTQNLYTYVHNNPVNFTDPTGHRECEGAYEGCKDQPQEPTNGTAASNKDASAAGQTSSAPTGAASGVPFTLACGSCTLGGQLVLIDENMNMGGLAEALRQLGYNVTTMAEAGLPVGKGFPDPSIIAWAKERGAYILTQNTKDFKKVYDLVIGAKNGWSLKEITGRMGELKRQYEANPQSPEWTTYISLMQAGRFVPPPLIRAPFFFMLDIRDPATGVPIWQLPRRKGIT